MSAEVKYRFNGSDISEVYGVFVSGSTGLFGKPKRKYNVYTFPGHSGHEVDMRSKTYDPRTIKLSCFLKASSDIDLINKHEKFTRALLDIEEYATLSISVGDKTITRKVYVSNISDMKKKWGENVGTFEVEFIEPNPEEETDEEANS